MPTCLNPDCCVMAVGSGGMLGADLVGLLRGAGLRTVCLGRREIDITRRESVRSALGRVEAPGLLINCAAYTAVDKAESEPEAAFAANRDGPANLADECARLKIPLIHISTDYVFNGKACSPYKEDDPADPINVYGMSKWLGEEAVRARLAECLIVRTSWLYGFGGRNFVKTMLKLGAEREELQVVSDQFGCPTWSYDLAGCLVRIAKRIFQHPGKVPWGTYHFCGKGVASWYEFASAILDEAKRRRPRRRLARILPAPSGSYPTVAIRPMHSALDCGKIEAAFGVAPPFWKISLARFMEAFVEAER